MAENVINGGIMVVAAPAAVQQIVYLDFDGELTSYNGEILTIDDVVVEDSGLNTEDISAIADKLNEDFADRGVIFVTERPAEGDFSTIYIGKTSSFEAYGNFAGLAETIDAGNLNQSDNAFVMLKGNESATAIADTIAHEVEHIVFGMTHAGSGLAAYAEDEKNPGYIYYYYSTNHTYTGTLTGDLLLSHYSSNRTYVSSRYQSDGGDDYVCKGSHYDSASNVTINSGNMWISRDGVANDTTVNSGGGLLFCSSGVANSTTVNSSGRMYISSGVANNTKVNHYGSMYISSGGVANDTTVNSGGYMDVVDGGVANSTTVNSGGWMRIYSGGTATDITVAEGGWLRITVAFGTYIQGTYNDSVFEMKDASISDYTIHSNGRMYISSGGVANSTTVNSGGSMWIDSGVANDTTMSGGSMWIDSGVANDTTMSGGNLYISSGGVANSTTVNSGGWMRIGYNGGGVANSTTMSGGGMCIYRGGVANSTTMSGGIMWVSSGGVANSTMVNSGGYMDVVDGGVANSTTVNSGGWMRIGYNGGGVANNTTVNSGGSMRISSGGTALEIIENGGYVGVYEGAEVTFVANTFSGLELTSQSATVHSGTTAVATTLNSCGSMYIYNGGVANSTVVNSGGRLFVYDGGGVANSTTVNSGGSMVISSGGILSGTTLLGGQMICFGTVDAEIIFAVDQRTTDDAAIIFNLAKISGATYTIQVDPTVSTGIYKLATGASSFTGTITVKTATDTIGDFVWNEVTGAYNTVANGDTVYSLQKQNGALNLLITSPIDVVWEMKEIGQPGFYTGAYGTGTDPAATYVAIPFLYSFSVSFDKELADGYYDFAFTLDGTDQTIVRTIQIVNGVAAYVDQLNQQTVASTSCSETADTYTYTFTDIADTILTETLTETISVSASYTGANHAYAVSGGANVSGTTTATGTLVNTRPHYDADKEKGLGIAFKFSTTGGDEYKIIISDNSTEIKSIVFNGDKLDLSKSEASLTVNSSGENVYKFMTDELGLVAIIFDVNGTDDPNTTKVDERLSILYSNGYLDPDAKIDTSTLKSQVKNDYRSEYNPDYLHCWVATAVNMMVAGGWLDTNNAQGVFESLSDKYYKKNKKKSTGGFPDQVFYDTIFHNWGNNVGIKNNIEYSRIFTGNKIEDGFSFLDANEDRATAGLSFVICDNAGKKTDARHIFTVYEINKKSNTEWELICTDSDTENASGGDKEVRHVEKINGEWLLINMPGQNNRKLIVEKFYILLNRAENINPVRISDWEYHRYNEKNVHAVKYGNFSTNEDGSVSIGAEGYMEEGIIGSEEKVIAETDSSINGVYLQNNASLLLKSGSEITGDIEISGGSVSMEKGVKTEDANIIFYLTDCEGENSVQLLDRIDYAAGAAFEIVVNSSQQTGRYLLAAGAENFDTEISVRGTGDYMRESDPGFNSGVLGTVSIDSALETYSRSYALTVADGKLYLDVETLIPLQLQSDTEGVAWVEASREDEYVVQYSRDEFEHAIEITVKGNRLDSLQLSDGSWQWRVRAKNNNNWNDGSWIIADDQSSDCAVVTSDKDGIADVFFARTDGQWSLLYQATHHGIKGGWEGTQDTVSLKGKNKIADVFEGATTDANVLVLTDDSNGDALFVDDIYGDSFEGVAQTQSRIANLDEIRAGAGDDVVDMTSQRFAYVGDGVTIYGGDGNDVIWSNKGNNQLFGDAGNDNIIGASGNDVIVGGIGNDRMHGGGGDDIFTFGGDWGNDTVEQLDTGSVTLWFEDGSENNWNADTRTYTDGENTVTVSGVSADDITLKFGSDISSLPDGVFADSVTEKIFEDIDSGGMLA